MTLQTVRALPRPGNTQNPVPSFVLKGPPNKPNISIESAARVNGLRQETMAQHGFYLFAAALANRLSSEGASSSRVGTWGLRQHRGRASRPRTKCGPGLALRPLSLRRNFAPTG